MKFVQLLQATTVLVLLLMTFCQFTTPQWSSASHVYERKYMGALCDGFFGNQSFVANEPNALFLYNETELYFTDKFTSSIKKINLQTNVVEVVVGTGSHNRLNFDPFKASPRETSIDTPTSVAVHNGIVYFTLLDLNTVIYQANANGSGTISAFAGNEEHVIVNAALSGPTFLNFYSNGDLLFYEAEICTIRKISGTTITTLAGSGSCTSASNSISGGITAMTISHPNQTVYVSTLDGTIMKLDGSVVYNVQRSVRGLAATFDLIYFTTGNNELSYIQGEGASYKTTILGQSEGFTKDGRLQGTGFLSSSPQFLVSSKKTPTIYFTEVGNFRIRSIRDNVDLSTVVGYGQPTNQSAFISPGKMAIVGSILYVIENKNGKVSRIDVSTGKLSVLDIQTSVSSIAASANVIYFASQSGNSVYRLLAGTLSTIAGNGTDSSTGDGGPASLATISRPVTIALDSRGDLYILSDRSIRRIRGGMITTVFTDASGGLNDIFISPRDEILISSTGRVNQLNCSVIPCSISSWKVLEVSPLAISSVADSAGYWSQLLIVQSSWTFFYKQGSIEPVPLIYNTKNAPTELMIALNVNGIAVNQTSGEIFISGPYGISTLRPFVLARESCPCSGNGDCYSNDRTQCLCDPGWLGTYCEIQSCGGIAANSSNVCSNGQGICTRGDTCVCKSGFVGASCQIPFCVGSTLNENFTCTGSSPIVNNSTKQQVIVEPVKIITDLNSKNVSFSKVDTVNAVFPSNFSTYISQTVEKINNVSITLVSSVVDSRPESQTIKSQVVSPVITLSLFKNSAEKISIRNLEKPIELIFTNIQLPKSSDLTNYTCMYFDSILNDWSEEGITSRILNADQSMSQSFVILSIKCDTNHLTSFAVIDRNYKKQATTGGTVPTTSEFRREMLGLSEAGIIAISVSIGGSCCVIMTLVTLITIVCVIVRRKKRASKDF